MALSTEFSLPGLYNDLLSDKMLSIIGLTL